MRRISNSDIINLLYMIKSFREQLLDTVKFDAFERYALGEVVQLLSEKEQAILRYGRFAQKYRVERVKGERDGHEFYMEGNKGGDYITIREITSSMMHIEIGHCCVVVLDKVVPVEVLTSVLSGVLLDAAPKTGDNVVEKLLYKWSNWDDEFKKLLIDRTLTYKESLDRTVIEQTQVVCADCGWSGTADECNIESPVTECLVCPDCGSLLSG